MVRRSTAPRVEDEATFPVRIALLTGGDDWMRWREVECWLRENIGHGHFAHHGLTKHRPHAMGIYFRTVDAAQRLLDAFPELELADSTETIDRLRQRRRGGLSS